MIEDKSTDDQIDQFPDLPAYNPEQVSGEQSNNKMSEDAKRILDKIENGEIKPELVTASNDETSKPHSSTEEKENQADKIWEVLTKNGSFFCDESGTPYYFIESIVIPIDSEEFMDYLIGLYKAVFDKIPNRENMSLVKNLSRYEARKYAKRVGVRVSKDRDMIIYDPCVGGDLIQISENGIEIIKPEKPLTVRFKGMGKTVINKEGTIDDLNSFLKMWNMEENNKILLSGYIGASFIPNIPHAILGLIGWHGSGKTSLTTGLRRIIDPNFVETQALSSDNRDLTISALHQWVLAFDNINGIIPPGISDTLCRIATGQGWRTRALYTDSDEVLIMIRRIIIINGISEPNQNSDFNDRTIYIELKPIHQENRLTDREVRESMINFIPKIRGYILSLVPEAMKMYPIVRNELEKKLPRMADFVIWGECFSRLMGYERLAFFKAFNEAQKSEIESMAENDLVVIGLKNILTSNNVTFENGEYVRTTSDLLEDLKDYEKSKLLPDQVKHIPRDAKRLGRRLKALAPDLYKMGIKIETIHGMQHIKPLPEAILPLDDD